MNNDDDEEDLDIELLWKQVNAVQAFSFLKKMLTFKFIYIHYYF